MGDTAIKHSFALIAGADGCNYRWFLWMWSVWSLWIYWHSHTTIAMDPKLSYIHVTDRIPAVNDAIPLPLPPLSFFLSLNAFGRVENRSDKIIVCWQWLRRKLITTQAMKSSPATAGRVGVVTDSGSGSDYDSSQSCRHRPTPAPVSTPTPQPCQKLSADVCEKQPIRWKIWGLLWMKCWPREVLWY